MNEDRAFKATKTMASQLAMYVMTVAEEYGEDKAFELLNTAFERYGRQVGEELKQELGDNEPNAQNIANVLGPLMASYGFHSERLEGNPSKVTVRMSRCPLFEACEEACAPAESFCKYMAEPLMNTVVKTINPKAKYRYLAHKETGKDYCMEQILVE